MTRDTRKVLLISFMRRMQLSFVLLGYRVLQCLVGLLVFFFFRIRVRVYDEKNNQINSRIYWSRFFFLQKPYILLAKHSSAWDPFILGVISRTPMHFISTDVNFRKPLLRFLLHIVGAGSIQKNTRDLRAVIEILYLLKVKREPVCIFPEGLNTWDGITHAIDPSIGKLIKRSQVPVYCARILGAYLAHPRWAKRPRRGRIDISIRPIADAKKLTRLSTDALAQEITTELNYQDIAPSSPHPNFYWYSTSQRRAEYIERLLFACTRCHSFNSIVSKNNDFYCAHCLSSWGISREGHFVRGQLSAEQTPHEWNAWQCAFLSEQLKHYDEQDLPFFSDPQSVLYRGVKADQNMGVGTLNLMYKKNYWILQWVPNSTRTISRPSLTTGHAPALATHNNYSWPLTQLTGLNIQNNEKLEWRSDKLIHQVYPLAPRRNTYKYLLACNILTQITSYTITK